MKKALMVGIITTVVGGSFAVNAFAADTDKTDKKAAKADAKASTKAIDKAAKCDSKKCDKAAKCDSKKGDKAANTDKKSDEVKTSK